MKIYSDAAVTKADLDAIVTTVASAHVDSQKGVKFWINMIACGTAINFALLAGLAFYVVH